jgi:7,8-dihydropterin-6-yl-methyl-4-(beta-D-ribofuranosyl)aminobenzene 5'-phosphate synthase
VFLTGEMGNRIAEQSLFLKSDSGLIVITGCSHPGIVEILRRVKTLNNSNIYLVVGGFHLMNHSPSQVTKIIEEIRKLGVKKIAPTHCTGEKAIELFREAYGDHCIKSGTGKVFDF